MKTYYHVRKNDITLDWSENMLAAMKIGDEENCHVMKVAHGVASPIRAPLAIQPVEIER